MRDPLKIIACGDAWLYEKATGMLKTNKPIIIEMDNGQQHTITFLHEGWHVVGESMTPVCADALISILSRKYLSSLG